MKISRLFTIFKAQNIQVMVNFNENLYLGNYSFRETKLLRSATALSDIPTSQQISGIEVRLTRVHIIDNKTAPVGPFPGLAKVYLLNIITSDILGSDIDLALDGFEKVDDNQTIAVDRTLFYWKKTDETPKSPSQIHIFSSLIKSKKSLRDTAKIIGEAKDNEKIKSLTSGLGELVKNASKFNMLTNVVMQVASVVGDLLGKVEDKPMLSRFQSFTDVGGNFNQLGKTAFPFGNMYANLDYSIFIRDKERQQEAEE